MVQANPWLSGNLVTGGPENKDSWGKVVVEFSAEAPSDCFHEAAEIPAKSAESLGDYASWSSEFTVHNLQVCSENSVQCHPNVESTCRSLALCVLLRAMSAAEWSQIWGRWAKHA